MIIHTEQDRQEILQKITSIDLDKGPWQVDGFPVGKKKSDQQRNYFHYLCRQLANEIGETEGTVKMLAKAKLCGTKQVVMRGIEITVPDSPSTEKYTKEQYSTMIETIFWLAAESGVVLNDGHL